MRSTLYGLVFLLTALLSAGVHWVLYRWARRALPSPAARRAAGLALAVLFAVPLLRAVPFLGEGVRVVGRVGMLWHLVAATTAAALLVLRGAFALADSVGKHRRPARAASGAHAPPAVDPPPAETASAASGPTPAASGGPVDQGRRLALERIGGVAALVASGGVVVRGATVGRLDWQIEEVAIRLPRLPRELDGLTIVQISDIHVGAFIGERELARGLELVQRLSPDLVAVTGDIVDHDPSYVALAARALGSLRARHGVVCIPGNHDHYAGLAHVTGALSAAGLEVLLNRSKVLASGSTGGLVVAGVDDLWGRSHRTGPGPDLDRALSGVRDDHALVLLAHQPTFFDEARKRRVDLQLSGHTHGGQINPGFVAARPVLGPYVAGRYARGEAQLYVNRGFGTAGPPCRLLAPPEITRLVLLAG